MASNPQIPADLVLNTDKALQQVQDLAKKPIRFDVAFGGGAGGGAGNLANSFSRPLGKISGDVSEFNKSLDAANARVIAFGASATAVFALERAFQALATTFIDVDKQLTDINVLLNLSQGSLKKFGDQLFDIAANTGQSFDTVAKAATELSRQGLGVEETLKRTQAALILTRLSGLDAAQSVEGLTTAINSFSKSGLDDIEIVNKLANVDAAFATSAGGLIQGIARVGSTAQDAGVDINQLIALIATVKQISGRSEATIGNALKSIFTRLDRSKVRGALSEVGISVSDSENSIQLLQKLAQNYDNLSRSAKSSLGEQVAGVFQINALKAALAGLSGEFSTYNRALKVATGSTDQAIQRNAELNKTIAALINETFVKLEQSSAALGENLFGPAIKNVLTLTNVLLDAFGKIDSESLGGKVGTGIIKGLGSFISGPGIALLSTVFIKLGAQFAKFAVGSTKDLLGLNEAAREQANIQASIGKTIADNNVLLIQNAKGEYDVSASAKNVLTFLEAQNAELVLQRSLATQISEILAADIVFQKIGSRGEGRAIPRPKAGGVTPLEAASEMGAAQNAGYSSPLQASEVRKTNIGGQDVVYNTRETLLAGGSLGIIPPKTSRAYQENSEQFSALNAAPGITPGKFIFPPEIDNTLQQLSSQLRNQEKIQEQINNEENNILRAKKDYYLEYKRLKPHPEIPAPYQLKTLNAAPSQKRNPFFDINESPILNAGKKAFKEPLAVAIGAQLVTSILAELKPFGDKTKEGRGGNQVISSLGNIAGFAGTGAVVGGGVPGVIGGAAIGAILEFPKVVNAFNSNLSELSDAADKAKEDFQKFNDLGTTILTLTQQVSDLVKDAQTNGNALEVLTKVQTKLAKALADLTPDERKAFANAKTPQEQQAVIEQGGVRRQTQLENTNVSIEGESLKEGFGKKLLRSIIDFLPGPYTNEQRNRVYQVDQKKLTDVDNPSGNKFLADIAQQIFKSQEVSLNKNLTQNPNNTKQILSEFIKNYDESDISNNLKQAGFTPEQINNITEEFEKDAKAGGYALQSLRLEIQKLVQAEAEGVKITKDKSDADARGASASKKLEDSFNNLILSTQKTISQQDVGAISGRGSASRLAEQQQLRNSQNTQRAEFSAQVAAALGFQGNSNLVPQAKIQEIKNNADIQSNVERGNAANKIGDQIAQVIDKEIEKLDKAKLNINEDKSNKSSGEVLPGSDKELNKIISTITGLNLVRQGAKNLNAQSTPEDIGLLLSRLKSASSTGGNDAEVLRKIEELSGDANKIQAEMVEHLKKIAEESADGVKNVELEKLRADILRNIEGSKRILGGSGNLGKDNPIFADLTKAIQDLKNAQGNKNNPTQAAAILAVLDAAKAANGGQPFMQSNDKPFRGLVDLLLPGFKADIETIGNTLEKTIEGSFGEGGKQIGKDIRAAFDRSILEKGGAEGALKKQLTERLGIKNETDVPIAKKDESIAERDRRIKQQNAENLFGSRPYQADLKGAKGAAAAFDIIVKETQGKVVPDQKIFANEYKNRGTTAEDLKKELNGDKKQPTDPVVEALKNLTNELKDFQTKLEKATEDNKTPADNTTPNGKAAQNETNVNVGGIAVNTSASDWVEPAIKDIKQQLVVVQDQLNKVNQVTANLKFPPSVPNTA